MRILNILNNSALVAVNERREEVVLIGRGISFGRRVGDEIDPAQADKLFSQSSPITQELLELFQSIPEEYFEMTNVIVRYANKKMKRELDKGIYLTLFDHINSAVERYREGLLLNFGMLEEMRILYPDEFKVAEWALEYINVTLNIELPEDECGFIGIHLIQAGGGDIPKVNAVMRIVKDISELVKEKYADQFLTEGVHFSRFITHLKFFSVRYLNHDQLKDDEPITFFIEQDLRDAVEDCLSRIVEMVEEKYGEEVTGYERSFLRLHLCQLLKKGGKPHGSKD